MLSRIHQKLGTAGFVISIVALVAALGGGAYAAKNGLTGKQKKEVEKIAKKYAGKPGPAGATGPAGAKGEVGAKGDTGAKGENGAPGTPGSPGSPGEAGSPWTAGGTLPVGATETGAWQLSGVEGPELFSPISFAIPLKTGLAFSKVHLVGIAENAAGACTGSIASPTAESGELCVYVNVEHVAEIEHAEFPVIETPGGSPGAGTAGALIAFEAVTAAVSLHGSFAVTG